MIIQTAQLMWIQVVSYAVLFVFCFVAIYPLLGMLPRRKPRFRRLRYGRTAEKRPRPPWLLALFLLRNEAKLGEREQILRAAGISADALNYELGRRAVMLLLAAIGALACFGFRHPALVLYVQPVYPLVMSLVGMACAFWDRAILEAVKNYRRERIVREIYALSNQLLYYSGSKMNLHGKLSRCLPYTRAIRRDFQFMLNEWYQDADRALRRFKERLGTDEVYSFVETIQSLRLNETEAYYDLLRARVRDYKDKIDLARESRKETVSYVLYVIAGLPIMNTFRVFIYPWVNEGRKLFDALQ